MSRKSRVSPVCASQFASTLWAHTGGRQQQLRSKPPPWHQVDQASWHQASPQDRGWTLKTATCCFPKFLTGWAGTLGWSSSPLAYSQGQEGPVSRAKEQRQTSERGDSGACKPPGWSKTVNLGQSPRTTMESWKALQAWPVMAGKVHPQWCPSPVFFLKVDPKAIL